MGEKTGAWICLRPTTRTSCWGLGEKRTEAWAGLHPTKRTSCWEGEDAGMDKLGCFLDEDVSPDGEDAGIDEPVA